jgi:hypothetical protein
MRFNNQGRRGKCHAEREATNNSMEERCSLYLTKQWFPSRCEEQTSYQSSRSEDSIEA